MATKKTAKKKTADPVGGQQDAPQLEAAPPDTRSPAQRFVADYWNNVELRKLFTVRGGEHIFMRTGLDGEQQQAARKIRKEYGF
ncbi:MAG: hypothetical protein GWN87_28530 [Desulfuromonadales bacterium]|nr:hypothetical protein [Desulfuromonadales bacterium]